MNHLPALLVEVTAVFAAALLIAVLASRARAAIRHLILVCAFGVALILPLATLVSPTITVELDALPTRAPEPVAADTPVLPAVVPIEVKRSRIESAPVAAIPSPSVPSRSIPVTTWLLLAWGVIALIALLPVAASLLHLRGIRRRGRPWPEGAARLQQLMHPAAARRPIVLLDDVIAAPITGGLVQPVIALPADAAAWSDNHLANALQHELEHVRRHDWTVHLAARAVCALYWFHPLAWMTWRALRLEAERACDDAVLAREDAAAYAEQLLALARRVATRHALPGMQMASTSNLSSRIRAVLDSTLPRGRAGRIALACIVIAAVVAVAVLAPLRATGPTRNAMAATAAPAVTGTSGDPAIIASIDAAVTTIDRDASRYRRTEHDLDGYSAESGDLVGLYDGSSLRKLSADLHGHNGELVQHMYYAADQLIFVHSIYDEYETKSRSEHRLYLNAGHPIRRMHVESQARPSEAILAWDPLPELLGRVEEFAACAAAAATFCTVGVGAVDADDVAFGYTDETGTKLLALPNDNAALDATRAGRMIAAVCAEGQVLPIRYLRMQPGSSASNGRQSAGNFANEAGPLFEVVTGRTSASDTCMLVPEKYLRVYRVSGNELTKAERDARQSAYWRAVAAADKLNQPLDTSPFHAPTEFARKILGAIEKAKKRTAKLYWLLYRTRPEAEIAAVEFTPDGDSLLGSIVLVEYGRLSFMDMPASLQKGQKDGGCWRVDDDCRFGVAGMQVQAMLGNPRQRLVFVTLSGAEGDVILLLQPKDGALVEVKRAYRYRSPV